MSLFGGNKKYYSHKVKRTLSKNSKWIIVNEDRTEASSCTCLKASMTVEATVVLPLFAGFMVFLMFYFRIMQVQIGVEQAMAYTARMTAASTQELTEEVSPGKVKLLLNKRIKKEQVPLEYVDKGLAGISISDSEFDNTQICLHVKYKMTLPIGFFGKLSYQAEQEVSARKWTGRVPEAEGKGKDAYVYVTETGEAYHKSRSCAYLDLSIHAVSASSLEDLRNKSGGRYRACSSCSKSGKKCSVYYITDYGGVYHCSITCRGLKRTVYIISLDEVGNRHACGKCTGG